MSISGPRASQFHSTARDCFFFSFEFPRQLLTRALIRVHRRPADQKSVNLSLLRIFGVQFPPHLDGFFIFNFLLHLEQVDESESDEQLQRCLISKFGKLVVRVCVAPLKSSESL